MIMTVRGGPRRDGCSGRMLRLFADALVAAFAEYAALDTFAVKDALRVKSIPSGVVVDTSFASTVLDGVWRGGIGEAVRFALARVFRGLGDFEVIP